MHRSDFNDQISEANALNSAYTVNEANEQPWHIDADLAWIAYIADPEHWGSNPVLMLVESEGPWWVQ